MCIYDPQWINLILARVTCLRSHVRMVPGGNMSTLTFKFMPRASQVIAELHVTFEYGKYIE